MTRRQRSDQERPALPEPPDGTCIEFEAATDLEAAWRDDESTARPAR